MVSKSSAVPALRNSSLPSTSKLAASAPERLRTLEPRASSVMRMSATLMRLVVEVFSARETMVLARASAEGGSLTGWLPKSCPGASSLLMVPVTGAVVPTVYPSPLTRVSTTVSFSSISISADGSTMTLAVADPAAKVTVFVMPASLIPV